MARSAGARPKRQFKKAYDAEFLNDFPPSSLFHEDFDLEEKGDTLQHVQSAKQSKTSKSKPATVPAASPPPISPEDSASFLTYDQQLQLIQLQKEKFSVWATGNAPKNRRLKVSPRKSTSQPLQALKASMIN